MPTAETVKEITTPSTKTLVHAARIGIVEDKPIMHDYWLLSLQKEVFIGVKNDNEKLLVKNEEEYTSCIKKIFRVESEYIIVTENSVYIVNSDIATKKVA